MKGYAGREYHRVLRIVRGVGPQAGVGSWRELGRHLVGQSGGSRFISWIMKVMEESKGQEACTQGRGRCWRTKFSRCPLGGSLPSTLVKRQEAKEQNTLSLPSGSGPSNSGKDVSGWHHNGRRVPRPSIFCSVSSDSRQQDIGQYLEGKVGNPQPWMGPGTASWCLQRSPDESKQRNSWKLTWHTENERFYQMQRNLFEKRS